MIDWNTITTSPGATERPQETPYNIETYTWVDYRGRLVETSYRVRHKEEKDTEDSITD